MPSRLPQSGQFVHVQDKDYRYGEGDVTLHVAGVGGTFSDPDGSRWVSLTGHRVLANGSTSPNSRTISARVSGIRVVRVPEQPEGGTAALAKR